MEINMKLFKIVILFVIIGYYSSLSQSLLINRNDLRNPESDFVTANYTFSFEIFLEGLMNSNSISFTLHYDHADYVKFSQWKRGDYDVLQAVNIDNGDGTAELVIGVSSGLIAQDSSNTTPKVIELEFVVTKDAPDMEKLIMTFERPVATTLDSLVGETIKLNATPLRYDIHSYVFVWPGDTDNNGIVDHLDFAPISQFIGTNSISEGMRSFRRPNSSALWTPQRALSWDSAAVTFADCDGNAEITTADLLIVTYNLGKTSDNPYGGVGIIGANNNYNLNPSKEKYRDEFASNDLQYLPIKINSDRQFTGVAGSIELLDNQDNFQEITYGEILPQNTYVHFYKKENTVYFVISNPELDYNLSNSGTLFNIVYKNDLANNSTPLFNFNELNAIDKNANIFELNSRITDVAELNSNNRVYYDSENIRIISDSNIEKISLNNIMGQSITIPNYSGSSGIIDISVLNSGLYILKYSINNTTFIEKIAIMR